MSEKSSGTSSRTGQRKGPRVLFLLKYGPRAAATRHRHLQYIPFLEQAGFTCDTSELLDDTYLNALFDGQRVDVRSMARGYVRRVALLRRIPKYDLVVIHIEALPYLPAFFERLLTRLGPPYVYDFDDAIFHQYDRHRNALVRALLGGKIPSVIRHADRVFAGNDYLARFAHTFNERVSVIPTVVDTTVYVPGPSRASDTVVIGWMGSPSTTKYVQMLDSVWSDVARGPACTLRLVGAGPVDLPATNLEVRPWAERHEVAELQQFDIGVMPLTDDPWSRGKCGFKLIQYMACGLPVVASPVGVNADIVKDGVTGFLCRSEEEWRLRLRELAADASLRDKMGAEGRRLATEHWSLRRWAPEVTALLREAAGRSSGNAAAASDSSVARATDHVRTRSKKTLSDI
jgi:glycosyltransferase involved in cell wall biosynthesis